MIIKSLSRTSGAGAAIKYLFKDAQKLMQGISGPLIIRHNLRTRTLEHMIGEFDANELRRAKRKGQVRAYHTIISFSDRDREHITAAMLTDITRTYIKLRGKDALYIATGHQDRGHLHIHVVESATKYMTGKAHRMSKAQFQALKIKMNEYQRETYPILTHSLPRHGNAKATGREASQPDKRATKKQELMLVLEAAYDRARSLEAFLDSLAGKGFAPYYRAGRLTGITVQGRKFRLSRLGYGTEQLQRLDETRRKDEAALAKLRGIRERSIGRSRGRERSRTDEW